MDTFPMIQRCAEAQWRGLGAQRQDVIALDWIRVELGRPPMHAWLGSHKVTEHVLWAAVYDDLRQSLRLVSIKSDAVPAELLPKTT